MGRLIKGWIITHLEGNNLIGDSQHGFRNKHSCLTCLLDFFASVIDTYDMGNNKAVDLIYLDFHHHIRRSRLLVKVMAHGIQVWHMPHGINIHYAPKNSYNYYLLYGQLSPARNSLSHAASIFIAANDF